MGGKNRIVVDYGDTEELVLLAAIKTETNEEIDDYDALVLIADSIGCPVVEKYDGVTDYNTLREDFNGDNKEGFIVKFKSGFRFKCKFEEYIRLHRIMTNVSTTSIWDVLRNGDDLTELIKDVPDEFYDKITDYAYELELNYQTIKARAYGIFYDIMETELGWNVDQKTFALRVKDEEYSSLLFLIKRGGDEKAKRKIDEIIWKMIKPEYERL